LFLYNYGQELGLICFSKFAEKNVLYPVYPLTVVFVNNMYCNEFDIKKRTLNECAFDVYIVL